MEKRDATSHLIDCFLPLPYRNGFALGRWIIARIIVRWMGWPMRFHSGERSVGPSRSVRTVVHQDIYHTDAEKITAHDTLVARRAGCEVNFARIVRYDITPLIPNRMHRINIQKLALSTGDPIECESFSNRRFHHSNPPSFSSGIKKK